MSGPDGSSVKAETDIPAEWVKLWAKPCGCVLWKLPVIVAGYQTHATQACPRHEWVCVLQEKGGQEIR